MDIYNIKKTKTRTNNSLKLDIYPVSKLSVDWSYQALVGLILEVFSKDMEISDF